MLRRNVNVEDARRERNGAGRGESEHGSRAGGPVRFSAGDDSIDTEWGAAEPAVVNVQAYATRLRCCAVRDGRVDAGQGRHRSSATPWVTPVSRMVPRRSWSRSGRRRRRRWRRRLREVCSIVRESMPSRGVDGPGREGERQDVFDVSATCCCCSGRPDTLETRRRPGGPGGCSWLWTSASRRHRMAGNV